AAAASGAVAAAAAASGATPGGDTEPPALFKTPASGARSTEAEPLSWTVTDTSTPSQGADLTEATAVSGSAPGDTSLPPTEAINIGSDESAGVPPTEPVPVSPTEPIAVASTEAITITAEELAELSASASGVHRADLDENDGIDDLVPVDAQADPGESTAPLSAQRAAVSHGDTGVPAAGDPDLDVDPINDSAIFGEALLSGSVPVSAVRASSASVTPPVLPQDDIAATSEATAAGTPSADKPARRRGSRASALTVTLIVAGLVLFFVIGLFLPRLFGSAAPVATPTPSTTPTPTQTAEPEQSGPAALGVQPWTALTGGECLSDYTDPWQAEFTVVDCSQPHEAQLVHVGEITDDPAAAFPGQDALASQIGLWCAAPGTVRTDAGVPTTDLQVQGSYPVTDEEWTQQGNRSFSCFVSRADGGELSEDLTAN
ncbi:MAG: hypothetical protein ACTJHU_10440, partial [Mycetocola sp.]